jgi:hypothetical protein
MKNPAKQTTFKKLLRFYESLLHVSAYKTIIRRNSYKKKEGGTNI